MAFDLQDWMNGFGIDELLGKDFGGVWADNGTI